MTATLTRSTIPTWLRTDEPKVLFIPDARARIFLLSFTMLFFELLCIRWIPSYVRYLSYFNNFLLFASFLGIGLGMLAARRQRFWYPPFPVMVLLLVIIVGLNKFEFHIASTQVLYFGGADVQIANTESFILLPLIFGLVTACFIPLSRSFGRLFIDTKPLTAYTFDIIGSLAGIAAFSLISYFALPPIVWFGVLALLTLLLSSRWLVLAVAAVFAITMFIVFQLQGAAYWSPYYKIVLDPAKSGNPPTQNGYIVNVNNTGHQVMIPWQNKEPLYRRMYEIFPGGTFHNILILGAGTGSDIATALHQPGVQSITAVEIDPTIQQLGSKLHPDHPYQDPRVKYYINDGRAFLENTNEKYDLIIFALPDSLTLTSNNTSLRLESFLLTQDSIASARTHLNSNGLFVMYNYYRQAWLVEKLADMAGNAFDGQQPLVTTYGGQGRAAVIMIGPKLKTLPPGEFGVYKEHGEDPNNPRATVVGEGFYPLTSIAPATDDWPFLYLEAHGFPTLYLAGLGMVLAFALLGTLALAPKRVLRRFDWHLFFLGVAFMLLEVKSLTTFSLLFGSTWLVNSLVFFAILSSVLLAILFNQRLKVKRIWILYVLLFAVLLLNLLLPPEALLVGNPIARYIFASLLAFTPVFLANIIFANSFRESENADIGFASNLLGILVGGCLEYLSMITGYRFLLVLVIVFYAVALLLRRGRGAALVPA